MTEIRKDFLTGNMVCIAKTRSKRPSLYKTSRTEIEDSTLKCPFCENNKYMTPKEVLAFENIRVIPNLYPVLDEKSVNGYGFHEVVIDTKTHGLQLKDYDIKEIYNIFLAFKERIKYFSANEKIEYIQIFKNQGPDAGATISHSHWQIVVFPFTPINKVIINNHFNEYYEENRIGYFEKEVENLGERLVLRKNDIVCFVPYAPLYYYGYHIMHVKNVGGFEDFSLNILEDMAYVLKKSLMALDKVLPNVSLNICLQLRPIQKLGCCTKNWHIYLQVIPRIANFAGFEIATNCHICSVMPEICGKNLRQYI